jgi:hypothetical protein
VRLIGVALRNLDGLVSESSSGIALGCDVRPWRLDHTQSIKLVVIYRIWHPSGSTYRAESLTTKMPSIMTLARLPTNMPSANDIGVVANIDAIG